MKKFMDSVDTLLQTSLMGFVRAHQEILELNLAPCYIKRKHPKAGKVALISGGGSGHEPLHGGFVGLGMLDAACPGQIFTSPTPDQMMAAATAVDGGAGVLFIVKNYAGDVMNFEMAAELCGLPVETVLVNDDIALPRNHPIGRRGVAGTAIVEKIVGAAAEEGASLGELKLLGERVVAQTVSLGVALTSCTVPALGHPTFQLAEDEMELGVGIHGERGRATHKLMSASEIAGQLVDAVCEDLVILPGSQLLVHVNGFGATPMLELHLMFEHVSGLLESRGLVVARNLVGSYTTSLDMAGCSLTVTLLDDELVRYWDAPVNTASLRWGC